MKLIEKPEWLKDHGFKVENLITQLIDNQNELIKWHDTCEVIDVAMGRHEAKAEKLPGHWECPEHGIGVNREILGGQNVYYVCAFWLHGSDIPGEKCLKPLVWIPDKPKEDGYYWERYAKKSMGKKPLGL